MTAIRFVAMPTTDAEYLWNGGRDAYDRLPETMVSDGPGHPCRHCLQNIDAGEELLVFAYRPFPELQPYAETGRIHTRRTAELGRVRGSFLIYAADKIQAVI